MNKIIFLFIFISKFGFVFSQKSIVKTNIKNNTSYEIPFTLDRHLIVLKVKFGKDTNTSYDLIFDTGTPGLYLQDSFIFKQGFKKISEMTEISIEGKDMGKRDIVVVDKINISNFILKTTAVKMPSEELFSPKAVGIIGLSAFNGYIVTIDYTNQLMKLKKGNLKNEKNLLKLNANSILEANIIVNNQTIPAHFDCGAPTFISIPESFVEKCNIQFKNKPKLLGRAQTPGSVFDILTAQLVGNMKIGNLDLENPQLEMVTAKFPAINIGYQFFKQHRVRIDNLNKLMQID
jgi:hypothetical protein